MSIYLDPEAVGVTASHLRAFEDGKYGPIFAHNAPLPKPQALGYTYQQAASPTGYSSASASSVPRILNNPYSTNTAPGGFPASTGNTAASDFLAPQRMISDSTDYYNADDAQSDDQPEEKED